MERLKHINLQAVLLMLLSCYNTNDSKEFKEYQKSILFFEKNNIVMEFEDYYAINGNYNQAKFLKYLGEKNINYPKNNFHFYFTSDTINKVGTNEMYFVSSTINIPNYENVIDLKDLSINNFKNSYCLLAIDQPWKKIGLFLVVNEKMVKQEDNKYLKLLRRNKHSTIGLHVKISRNETKLFFPKKSQYLVKEQKEVIQLLKNDFVDSFSKGESIILKTL